MNCFKKLAVLLWDASVPVNIKRRKVLYSQLIAGMQNYSLPKRAQFKNVELKFNYVAVNKTWFCLQGVLQR